jgi:hypothetical protein
LAASSQTVNTKSSCGTCGLANSSQGFERRAVSETPHPEADQAAKDCDRHPALAAAIGQRIAWRRALAITSAPRLDQPRHRGAQHAAEVFSASLTGFTARMKALMNFPST